MIEYYIDGSSKEKRIGVGIVKVNEFGFIEKHHFNVEHINPTSTIAEGYSLERTLEMIKGIDMDKNELIDIYTDYKTLYQSLLYNENIEFNNNNFFSKQENNPYFQHIRNLYLELISKSSKKPIYHCEKTHIARPLIKVYFKDDLEDKKYLQDAHVLSRQYIKEEEKPKKLELKAIRENNKWIIIKDNKFAVSENKRPLLALSDALKQKDAHINQIIICEKLDSILKGTMKNRLSNEDMKSAMKIIEKHKKEFLKSSQNN